MCHDILQFWDPISELIQSFFTGREFPSIEIYPNERAQVQEGSDTLIQCKVNKGIPSPSLRWYRPGNLTMSSRVEEISGVLKYVILGRRMRVALDSHSIFIYLFLVDRFTRVTAEDAGEYICSAENMAGHVDAVAYLDVISPPTISITPSGPININVGQYIKLECRAEGKPVPQVIWKSGNLPLSP